MKFCYIESNYKRNKESTTVAYDDQISKKEIETIDIDDLSPLEMPITPPSGLRSDKEKDPIYIEPSRKNRTWIFVLIAIVVILGGGAAAAYLYFHQNPTALASIQSHFTPVTQPSNIKAKPLVEQAQLVAKGTVKQTKNGSNLTADNVFSAPSFEPSGYQYSVRPTVDYGFGSYGSKDLMTTDLATIQGVLVQNKLTATILNKGSATEDYAAQFDSTDVTCLVTNSATATEGTYSVILGCANKSDYGQNAAPMRSFFLVLKTAYFGTDRASNLVLSNLRIVQSKTSGYSRASIDISNATYGSVGGYTALFYATPDSVIHYFTNTQGVVPCSQFNTDDLKKAFDGATCGGGNEVVTL